MVRPLLPAMCDVSLTQRLRSGHRAFTLVELLVVLAIIAVLTALLLPVLGRVRKEADSVQCVAQLRQLGTGIAAYANDHDGTMPGPLEMKQDAGAADGSLAALLKNYLTPSGSGPAAATTLSPMLRQDLFLCPAAARELRARKAPTYIVNMLPVPGFNQPVWGAAALGQDPLRLSALTNWNEAEIGGRPLGMAELWAIKDGDQRYFQEIGAETDAVRDLPLQPAHGGHRNALFFDFHVARVEIIRVVVTITPDEASPAEP